MAWDDDPASWDEDPEGPSEEDRRRFSSETIRCTECGGEIHDESVSCPICGCWMTDEGRDGTRRRGPATVIGVGLAALLAAGGLVWWLLRAVM